MIVGRPAQYSWEFPCSFVISLNLKDRSAFATLYFLTVKYGGVMGNMKFPKQSKTNHLFWFQRALVAKRLHSVGLFGRPSFTWFRMSIFPSCCRLTYSVSYCRGCVTFWPRQMIWLFDVQYPSKNNIRRKDHSGSQDNLSNLDLNTPHLSTDLSDTRSTYSFLWI